MIRRLLARGDDRGQVLLLTALSMTALLGVAALSLDASFMYDERNELHAAADSAAKSAAIEVHRAKLSGSALQTALELFADHEVAAHGFTPARAGGTTTVTVNHPPVTSDSYVGDPNYVEVVVATPTNTFLGGVLGIGSLTPGARSIAGPSSAPECLVTLDPAATSLSVGNSQINQPSCGVAAAGAMAGTHPNARITAWSIGAETCAGNCSQFTPLILALPPPSDPLESLPAPAACTGIDFVGTGAWPPGCYNNVTLSGITAMAAGDYMVHGVFKLQANAIVTGSGEQFLYLGPAASTNFGSTTSLTLVAPSTGAYRGIAVYQDRVNSTAWDMSNAGSLTITGAFYAPRAQVSLERHMGAAGDCAMMVVYSLLLSGNNEISDLANTCTSYGGSPLLSVSLAE